ncbi:MAG TPA: DUF885 domain-containing protein [Gemmatimonadaceae bacterium]|nr:DUF885 domain-containing protein [Gemmatimonadaceae bacterium]
MRDRSGRFWVRSILGAVCIAGCARSAPFPDLAREFVYTSLAFSPTNATQVGLHQYVRPASHDTLRLDRMLDDFSTASLDRQRAYFADFAKRLKATRRESLDPQSQADYDVLQNAVDGALFSLNEERFTDRRPQLYPEVLGNALFGIISLEYADTAARASDLAARLRQVPAFVRTATTNLTASNEEYRATALDEMSGVSDLIGGMGAQFVKHTPSESTYAQAMPAALAAIARFNTFVRDTLPKRGTFDWRMGRRMFDAKWRYSLQTSITPAGMLQAAEDSMRTTRARMLRLALPLHAQWFPGHRHSAADSTSYLNTIVSEVLVRIGSDHTNRDSLESQAVADVKTLGDVVRNERLLSLTDFSNVRVIPTPVFMRGGFGVAGAVGAPPLAPKLSSFYWVTPIPKEWPANQAEAKMREYNRLAMRRLTIHEALPGHLVQGEYANRVTPEWRRVLRSVYGNGPYAEGWAEYAEFMLQDAGVYGADSIPAELTVLKGMLRLYSNVIIDAKLHTEGMPTDSVVPFLVRESFQEKPEAIAKLQRAELDYVQLNMYPIGLAEWEATRNEAMRREGSAFSLCRFNDVMLSYGALPVPAARRLYEEGVAPTAEMPASRCVQPDGGRVRDR